MRARHEAEREGPHLVLDGAGHGVDGLDAPGVDAPSARHKAAAEREPKTFAPVRRAIVGASSA